MGKFIQTEKMEKEKRFTFLRNEISRQERILLDNKKILDEKEKIYFVVTKEHKVN